MYSGTVRREQMSIAPKVRRQHDGSHIHFQGRLYRSPGLSFWLCHHEYVPTYCTFSPRLVGYLGFGEWLPWVTWSLTVEHDHDILRLLRAVHCPVSSFLL